MTFENQTFGFTNKTNWDTDKNCTQVYQQLLILFPPVLWSDFNYTYTIGGIHPSNLLNNNTFVKCIYPFQGIMEDHSVKKVDPDEDAEEKIGIM